MYVYTGFTGLSIAQCNFVGSFDIVGGVRTCVQATVDTHVTFDLLTVDPPAMGDGPRLG